MGIKTVLIYHSARGRPVPERIVASAQERGLRIQEIRAPDEVVAAVNRSYPGCVVVDVGEDGGEVTLCKQLKGDPFTAIIPIVMLVDKGDASLRLGAIEAGADEVLDPQMADREQRLRLARAIERASRDVSVHPTTRLPGTVQIERDISDRLAAGELFACCYADLDHFKEFNDRYGYNRGDRVIQVLSRILRDVVKGCAPTGFIGHIGGDDFIFNTPLGVMPECCQLILETFDELIPYHYGEQDRRAGYFLGKDRRGNLHRVPLMTLSIGVVTNQHRNFTHTGRVSELATEMKAYAKTLPGSIYAVDRRRDLSPARDTAEPRTSEPIDERRLSKL